MEIQLKPWRSERGSSLVQVIIAIGVLGLGIKAINDQINFGMKAQKKLAVRSDLEAIKRMILKTVSCKDTYTETTCPSTSSVAIKRRMGSNLVTFIPAQGKLFGNWAVKANCSPDNDGLIARAIYVDENANVSNIRAEDILPDPLTGQKYDWNSAESMLFPAGITFCPDRSGLPTPSYDSGWVANNQTLTHNLGTMDYAVFIEWKTAGGNPHSIEYNFRATASGSYLNSTSFNRAKWVNKTSNTIRVEVTGSSFSSSSGSTSWINSPHTALVRVMLYRYY